MSRLLGIDLGTRRIGIALADPDGRALPLVTLRRGRDATTDGAALQALIDAHDVTELIVGLPLEASGEAGPQVVHTRAWVAAVEPCLRGVSLAWRDERLSSHVAESRVGPMKRGRSGGPPSAVQRAAYRARIDREAAAVILQDELDARAEAAS
ncbi:MAG: Holliday junction resolvase RuvX [Candidatus Limnocylindrales bacterium]